MLSAGQRSAQQSLPRCSFDLLLAQTTEFATLWVERCLDRAADPASLLCCNALQIFARDDDVLEVLEQFCWWLLLLSLVVLDYCCPGSIQQIPKGIVTCSSSFDPCCMQSLSHSQDTLWHGFPVCSLSWHVPPRGEAVGATNDDWDEATVPLPTRPWRSTSISTHAWIETGHQRGRNATGANASLPNSRKACGPWISLGRNLEQQTGNAQLQSHRRGPYARHNDRKLWRHTRWVTYAAGVAFVNWRSSEAVLHAQTCYYSRAEWC